MNIETGPRNALPPGTGLREYSIESVLGAGGFGIIYRARHQETGGVVAIKEYFPREFAARDRMSVVPAGRFSDSAFASGLERFVLEARQLEKFQTLPGVVCVRTFFRANGTAYLVLSGAAPIALVVVSVPVSWYFSNGLMPDPQPFTIMATPADATVRFSDLGETYAPGMRLAAGTYRVWVGAEGYEPWEGTIAHGAEPTRHTVVLALLPVGSSFADALSSGGQGPEMVAIQAGRFRMGCVSGRACFDDLPVHEVTIPRAFAVSKHEVTFADWDRCAAAGDAADAARTMKAGAAAGDR